MDFQRLFLFLIFSFSALLLWDGWQRYQHPAPVQIATEAIVDKNQQLPVSTAISNASNIDKSTEGSAVISGKKIVVHTDNHTHYICRNTAFPSLSDVPQDLFFQKEKDSIC